MTQELLTIQSDSCNRFQSLAMDALFMKGQTITQAQRAARSRPHTQTK